MGEKSLGQIFVEGFVRAIPWTVMFTLASLFVVNSAMNMLRQEVKEAMEYGAHATFHFAIQEALHDRAFNEQLLPKIKQNAKEAIEFAAGALNRQPGAGTGVKAGAKR
ncbi:MAG: hypothetical protein AB1411_13985 [Nitrospirota bacterium]